MERAEEALFSFYLIPSILDSISSRSNRIRTLSCSFCLSTYIISFSVHTFNSRDNKTRFSTDHNALSILIIRFSINSNLVSTDRICLSVDRIPLSINNIRFSTVQTTYALPVDLCELEQMITTTRGPVCLKDQTAYSVDAYATGDKCKPLPQAAQGQRTAKASANVCIYPVFGRTQP